MVILKPCAFYTTVSQRNNNQIAMLKTYYDCNYSVLLDKDILNSSEFKNFTSKPKKVQ